MLFGPSGSGKTTTLNAIAGLITPESGHIELDGEVLFHWDGAARPVTFPCGRHIGYVFQHYALFPHLTASENVAYALRGAEGRKRMDELLERMGLAHLAATTRRRYRVGSNSASRSPRAGRSARVLLLDEPFSALDVAACHRLQSDLLALERDLRLPVVYVTHRLEDAFAVGQRLAVMRDGKVEQVGPIDEVFRRPVNAALRASWAFRTCSGHVWLRRRSGVRLDWEGLPLLALPQDVELGSTVTAYIRPEDVKIIYPGRPLSRPFGTTW